MSAPSYPIELPQLTRQRKGGCGSLGVSRRGRQRAIVLVLVHVIIIAHFMQWYIQGKTITPVEPSEAMQTLEQGKINAGFVLFALAILATLIFGRFFCGWACHIVAVQDLATWLLKRAGIRTKPFRSRLLIFVPLIAALYMFVWPSAARLFAGADPPEWVAHFVTTNFWQTFPGPFISALTLVVCGPLIVYLLGNKGFCTYACPYGGFFGPADTVAPMRIRVTDACEGCGHCTAVCTSNVRVHEEVRDYRAVVDPGCMKCLDCVDVCPKNALYVGWGAPAVATARRTAAQRPRHEYDYSWGEEIAMVLIFCVSLYIFRGLYEAIPFLLSLGLSGIVAFLTLTFARLTYTPNVRLHRYQLRRAGRITRAGYGYSFFMLTLFAFLAHSGVVQFMTHEGARLLSKTEVAYQKFQQTAGPEIDALAIRSVQYLEFARRVGLATSPNLEAKLGFLHSYLGDFTAAERHLREAIRLKHDHGGARKALAEMRLAQGQPDAAFEELLTALRAAPESRDIAPMLADLAMRLNRPGPAVDTMRAVLEKEPHHADLRLSLGMLLAQSGNLSAGLAEVRHVVQELPRSSRARLSLGSLLAESGALPEAMAAWEEAIRLDNKSAEARLALGKACLLQRDLDRAVELLESARGLRPLHPDTLYLWSQALLAGGMLDERTRSLQSSAETAADWYALMFLHLASGDAPATRAAYERAVSLNPRLPAPFRR